MKPTHYISDESLQFAQLKAIIEQGNTLALSSDALSRITKCRSFLEQKIGEEGALYYGINTGFGSLCNMQISHEIGWCQEI